MGVRRSSEKQSASKLLTLSGTMFPPMQIHDLIHTYASKSDEELLSLAREIADLTFEAQTALQSELARRGLGNAISVAEQDRAPESMQQRSDSFQMSVSQASVGQFVAKVTEVYRSNFWVFVKLIAPAVVLGYFAIMLGRTEGREIARNLPRGAELLQHRVEIIEIWIVNLGGGLVSWMAFCVSFAGICSAVAQLQRGMLPTVSECFVELRKRVGSFVGISISLYLLLLLGLGLSSAVTFAIMWALSFRLASIAIMTLSYAVPALAVWVLSRFSLSIPAVLLGDCTVGQAMFRSDELTEGKWVILASLLTKSLVGGYIAGMLPFWIAGWIWGYVRVPTWVLAASSISAVVLVEPFMFIGFSLLYTGGSAKAVAEAGERFAPELT